MNTDTLRSHANFVFHRCEDGAVIASEMRVAAVEIEQLRSEIAWLRKELRWLKQLSEGHHADQPSHVLLHSLTIDIPAHIESMLDGKRG